MYSYTGQLAARVISGYQLTSDSLRRSQTPARHGKCNLQSDGVLPVQVYLKARAPSLGIVQLHPFANDRPAARVLPSPKQDFSTGRMYAIRMTACSTADVLQPDDSTTSPPMRSAHDSESRSAMSPNPGPLTQSRSAHRSNEDPPAIHLPPTPKTALASRITSASSLPLAEDPTIARARIQAERAEMEEKLKRLREEEDRLAKIEMEKQQREVEERQIREELQRKKDELERQRAERELARRREMDERPPSNMYPPRPLRDRPPPNDLDLRDANRRPGFASVYLAYLHRLLTPCIVPRQER